MVIDLSDERIAQNIADNLHRLLRDRGINQSELARRAGISKMAVSRYLRLQIIPGSPALARMAHALCTTTDELVRDPKNPVPGLDRE
jgi:transcriptional regulator with XRE-family HTH domain